MSSGQNNDETPRKERPQYYYFYGSMEAATSPSKADGKHASPASPTNEQDSLVGESLVPTDTEQEDEIDIKSGKDLAHVLLMSGDEVKPLVGSRSSSINGHHNNNHHRSPRMWASCWASWRERHPIVHISIFGAALAVLLFVVSIVVFPENSTTAQASASASQTAASGSQFKMLFKIVDRASFSDPVSNFIEKDLFHPSLLDKRNDQPHEFVFPFPTGAFWTNLVLKPTSDRGLSYPIVVYPYAFKWSSELLQVSYPAAHRKEEPKAIHDYFFPDLTFSGGDDTAQRYVTAFDPLSVTLRYKTTQGGSWETYLVQGSPYVTIRYQNVAPVIRALSTFKDVFCPRDEDGSIDFDGGGKRQRRRRLIFGVCSTVSSSDGSSTILRGVQFIVQSNEGMNWLVFASEPITFVFDQRTKTIISSQQSFNGVLRFAYIAPSHAANNTMVAESANLQISTSKGLQRLIYHAGVYPVAGSVSWTFRPAATSDKSNILKTVTGLTGLTSSSLSAPTPSPPAGGPIMKTRSSRIGTIHFDYTTETFSPSSSASAAKRLLMLALPHHAQSLPKASQLSTSQFDLVYKCIKGPMKPVLGSGWDYDEILPELGFDGNLGSDTMGPLLDPNVRATIIESLQTDVKLAPPTLTENIYGFGKQSARLAQIAHIANSLLNKHNSTATRGNETLDEDSDKKALSGVLDQAHDLLSSLLTKFLTSKVADTLVFDANLGGLVTTDGLLNSGADFGNGRYNDHHFHYGYLLYACAIMGNLNSTFVENYGDLVDAIYFDVAHSSNFGSHDVNGVFFPGARHKMWFDGHSFASGLFPFGNGKSQESSSEAVNCYYGAYLWSLVRNGAGSDPASDTSARTDFARLLLATEIRGARLYWHMSPPPDNTTTQGADASPAIYNAQFSSNYMVGNLGMLDAVCSTWFGTENLYVHMINFMPVTAATGDLFSQDFVSKELSHTFPPHAEVEMAWRGYVVADSAIVEANNAWEAAQDLFSPELDSGLSKSQVLYWIATRAGFDPKNTTSRITPTSSSRPGKSDNDAEIPEGTCQKNSACSEAGLTGECCPTPDGTFLECCD